MATIIRGSGYSAVTQGVSSPAAQPAQAVAITDGEGTLLTLGAGGTLPISSGSGPTTSLNAVTATGAGTVVDLGVVRSAHTLQTSVTGGPSAVTVNLEGSLSASGPWVTLVASTSTTGDVQTASGKAVRYVRANLATLTGGTAPTVTALVASSQ